MTKTILKWIVICFLFTGLTACEENQDLRDLKTYVNKIRENSAINFKKKGSLGFQLPTPVTYQAGGFANATDVPNDSNTGAAKNPLVAYPLKSYQFTGVLAQGNKMWGYILAPDNSIYQVKEGDTLGNTYAKITKIGSNHMDVLEKGMDSQKKPIERIVVLQLKD